MSEECVNFLLCKLILSSSFVKTLGKFVRDFSFGSLLASLLKYCKQFINTQFPPEIIRKYFQHPNEFSSCNLCSQSEGFFCSIQRSIDTLKVLCISFVSIFKISGPLLENTFATLEQPLQQSSLYTVLLFDMVSLNRMRKKERKL